MIVNRGNMGEVCVLFVTLLYAPGASSAQSDACRTLVQPSASEYLDCPPLVTTRLLNRNVNQPTNQLPQIQTEHYVRAQHSVTTRARHRFTAVSGRPPAAVGGESQGVPLLASCHARNVPSPTVLRFFSTLNPMREQGKAALSTKWL